MTKGSSQVWIWVVSALVIIGGVVWWSSSQTASGPSNLDSFAQCLKDKGATFYGAFWCPHCQNQKKMFGSSAKLLPYVECSTPDGQGQTQICKDKKISGYPTWIFADGSQLTGEIPLADLAAKTSCQLPGAASSTATTTAK